jgi:hypothetical protein
MVLKDRSSTMKTMKTLMLAGVAAMSLGVGAAMAQEGGLSVPAGGLYQTQRPVTTTQAPANGMVQSGSSDVEPSGHSPYSVTTQPQFDFSNGSSGG